MPKVPIFHNKNPPQIFQHVFHSLTAAATLGILANVQLSICASVTGRAVEVCIWLPLMRVTMATQGNLATKWEVRKRFGSMGLSLWLLSPP